MSSGSQGELPAVLEFGLARFSYQTTDPVGLGFDLNQDRWTTIVTSKWSDQQLALLDTAGNLGAVEPVDTFVCPADTSLLATSTWSGSTWVNEPAPGPGVELFSDNGGFYWYGADVRRSASRPATEESIERSLWVSGAGRIVATTESGPVPLRW